MVVAKTFSTCASTLVQFIGALHSYVTGQRDRIIVCMDITHQLSRFLPEDRDRIQSLKRVLNKKQDD
jgi:hypothetical protein